MLNVEKQDMLPLEWARSRYGDQLAAYLLGQDLTGLPGDITDFLDFYEERRQRLSATLQKRLGMMPQS